MNAKENALRILRFDRPERIVSGLPSHGVHYRGCNHESYENGGHDCPVGTMWTDVWGTVWKKEMEGVMGFPQVHPLTEIKALKTYRWPDPDDERISGWVYEKARQCPRDDLFLSGSHRETLWEKTYMLVGMETIMTYFFTEPQFAREILHRVMDFQLGVARHYLAVGIEVAGLGDDLGTQAGPLLGPDLVEQFLVPEYRRLFDLYRKHSVIIGFHSCGKIESVLDTFMELGVDVLNPVQATANDLDRVRSATQGRMALQGAVSTDTIMSGPIERIVAEARQRMWQLGRQGGYFCGPDQGMPFPEAHIQAFREGVDRFGVYPIQPPER
ncbi:MAG TPA: uroporphyrinogen decarboxylase family protein [Phycisphaerae bacterium]|nr:uroporphyrinogen decarboxylase family protein [Phycisphaerae bacterium]